MRRWLSLRFRRSIVSDFILRPAKQCPPLRLESRAASQSSTPINRGRVVKRSGRQNRRRTEDDDEDDSWYLRSSSNLWGKRLVFVPLWLCGEFLLPDDKVYDKVYLKVEDKVCEPGAE
jgi:hypothetical protein